MLIVPVTEAEVRQAVSLQPTHCFIRKFVEYASLQVSSHSLYHVGTALSLAGVSSPRNLMMPGFKRATIPNVYAMIVGASGEAEKTTAIDVGQSILSFAAPKLIGADPTADESLAKALEAQPNLLFIYVDYATFLSKTSGNDVRGSGLRSGFLSFYDGFSFERVYSRGKPVVVHDPRPSKLVACTPEHLESYTNTLDWAGGFISRFFICYGEKERDNPWPKPWPEMREFLAQYVVWSAAQPAAAECSGLTEEAQRCWESWDKSLKAQYSSVSHDSKTQGLVSRTRMQATKSALLIAWSSLKCLEPWRMTAEDLEAGIALANLSLRSALFLAQHVSFDKDMAEQQRLLKAIGNDWTNLGEVTLRADLTVRKSRIYLETLLGQGRIVQTQQGDSIFLKRTNAGAAPYDHQLMQAALAAVPPAPIIREQ